VAARFNSQLGQAKNGRRNNGFHEAVVATFSFVDLNRIISEFATSPDRPTRAQIVEYSLY